MFWVYPHKWSQLNFQKPSIINRHTTDGHVEMTRSQVPCPRLYLQQWEFIPTNVEPGHVTGSSVHCPYMTLPLTKKHWLKWSYFTWCFWESVRSDLSCSFSRWGSWGFQRPPPHKVNLVVRSIAITLGQQGGVGSRMRQGKMPSLTSEFKAQSSRIPSQMIYVPVLIILPFTILEASLGEELYLF